MERIAQLEATLTEEGRYRLLVDAITDYAIYMLDPDGLVTSWNRGAERIKGYRPDEIIGQHFSRFYTEQDRAAGRPAHALAIALAEGRFETENWQVRSNGARLWTHVVIDPIHARSGELLGFAKITRDLTERRDAQDVLRRSEEQFRRLVQGVTDYALYMLTPDGYVASWNLGAERIKGYRPDEIIGEHFSRFYTEEDRANGEPARGLATAIREGRFEKEGWRVRKDGSRFQANVVIDAIRDEDGGLRGFAKITRDITERNRAQHALEQAREALFQTQKVEAIGQLTGGMAHDFNNLLMVILGSLELLRKRVPEEDRYLSLVDNAIQGARRGATLTQRMLAFARRQDLDTRPTDLVELVGGMSALLQGSLGALGHVETRFPAGLPRVTTDPNQLEAALLNLAVNARDAMPDGGSIVIAAGPRQLATETAGLAPGRYVCLSVSDTGEGMDAATLARAADPFFTTKGVGKGTGLGLSMVQGLAEQSGGGLVIKSALGEGTDVEIWLPVAQETIMPDRMAAAAIDETPGQPAPLVILAVDDDALVLMNTAALLEDLGHTAIEAMSGTEAIEILRRGDRVDLVISDHAMPRMTGVELAELIKAGWPALPVILATGYAELPDGRGADLPRLSKPFSQQQLADAIAAITRAGSAAPRTPRVSNS